MLNITVVYLNSSSGTFYLSNIMTCHCGITLKINRCNKLITIGCSIIACNHTDIEISIAWGTTIYVFKTTKLSSDLTVKLRRTWADSRMKVTCKTTRSSQQDFHFVGKLQNYWPKRRNFKLVGWFIAKITTGRSFSVLEFPVKDPYFTQRYITNILPKSKYAVLLKHFVNNCAE